MSGFIAEFKAFAMKGNVVELAVAVIIGAAFGKIVSSLVDNIVMPLFGVVLGGINFENLSFEVGNATVTYGVFLQRVVDFLIIAFVIFLAVKAINNFNRKEEEKPPEEKTVEPAEDIKLLTEIRDLLKGRG